MGLHRPAAWLCICLSALHGRDLALAAPTSRVAIVTGGTRGIGKGISEALAEQGYDLLLTYNTDADAAAESAESLTSEFGCRVECVGGDVSLAATRDKIFQCCDEKFKGQDLGAVVHNAGQYVGITASNADGLEAQQLGSTRAGSIRGACCMLHVACRMLHSTRRTPESE
mmetsp:Transcript_40546/g.93181  ORF Transcript_40546/g.93181 Transcript_40546/m.93181 type:complete len:170 (-) Transcript_40546:735-1244(-)